MFKEERNANSFIGGLITGGVVGGLVGLLFAPKSGREFRKDISDKSGEILDDTNRLIEDAKDKAAIIVSEAMKKAECILEDGRINGKRSCQIRSSII